MDNSLQEIGQVNQSGSATITLSDYSYHGLFFAQAPGSSIKVPFALDFHNTSNAKFKKWKTIDTILLITAFTGIGATVVGAIAGAPLVMGVGGVSAIGASCGGGIPINTGILSASTVRECYEYEPIQNTNCDLVK